MMDEAHGLSLHAREQAQAKARAARDATARATARERIPAPLVCPPGATEKQRVAWHSAMGEVLMRERQTSIQRGWQRIQKQTAPNGCVPLCCLWGAKMVVLAVDLRGAIRLVEDGRAGAVITVSEAAAMARG